MLEIKTNLKCYYLTNVHTNLWYADVFCKHISQVFIRDHEEGDDTYLSPSFPRDRLAALHLPIPRLQPTLPHTSQTPEGTDSSESDSCLKNCWKKGRKKKYKQSLKIMQIIAYYKIISNLLNFCKNMKCRTSNMAAHVAWTRFLWKSKGLAPNLQKTKPFVVTRSYIRYTIMKKHCWCFFLILWNICFLHAY